MHDDNHGSTILFGGLIAALIIGMFAIKFITAVMNEIAKALNAFGDMCVAFATAAWGIILIVGLVAVGIAAVTGAIYFTYKYILMVRRGTEIQKGVRESIDKFKGNLLVYFEEHKVEVQNDFKYMQVQMNNLNDKLVEATKSIDVLPDTATTESKTESSEPKDESITNSDAISGNDATPQSMNPY